MISKPGYDTTGWNTATDACIDAINGERDEIPDLIYSTLVDILEEGDNVTLDPNPGTKTIGISATGTGGGGIPESEIDAKGDLLAGTGADAVTRLAVGTEGQTLVVNSGAPTGLTYLGFSVYVVTTGDDSDLAAALATAPESATLVAVKVA